MQFSNDIIELPKNHLPVAIKAEIICNPEVIPDLISSHTSSAVMQDLSNFARHLSAKAKSFLSRLGLRKITASLFVSAATSEYWGFNGDGNLCRLVPEQYADGFIDGFDAAVHADLASAYSMGRLEASL